MRGGKRKGAGRKKDFSVTDIHIKIKTHFLNYILDNVVGECRNEKINNYIDETIFYFEKKARKNNQ